MSGKPKVLLAAAGDELKDVLERLAEESDDLDFDYGAGRGIESLNGEAVKFSALLVEIDLSRAGAVDRIADLARSLPERRVIAATGSASAEDIRRLFRAGVADVITPPYTAEMLRSALLDVVRLSDGGPQQGGTVITALKAGGGVGATTTLLNLARCLSREDRKRHWPRRSAAVVDFDLQLGDTSTSLNIEARSTILDVVRAADRFDSRFLQSVLTEHDGLHLLAPAPGLVPLDAISPELALDIIHQASLLHDLTFVDMPGAWTDWTAPVLDRSDLIVLVATPTVSSVLRARRLLDALQEAHIDTPVFFVINHLGGLFDVAERPQRIERSLNVKVDATLSQDATAGRAADRGELVVDAFPGARLSRDIQTAAANIRRRITEARPEPHHALSGEAL